jgi:predicted transposase/invertase (TIGR01784 family)
MDVLECLPEAFQCEAFRKLKEVSDVSKLTEDERYVYERNLRNYRDTLSLYLGLQKQYLAKGEAKKAISIAKNMKKKKMSTAEISEITGLSVEEIEKL